MGSERAEGSCGLATGGLRVEVMAITLAGVASQDKGRLSGPRLARQELRQDG